SSVARNRHTIRPIVNVRAHHSRFDVFARGRRRADNRRGRAIDRRYNQENFRDPDAAAAEENFRNAKKEIANANADAEREIENVALSDTKPNRDAEKKEVANANADAASEKENFTDTHAL